VPLFGVAFFDWDILAILMLYWTESVIVGGLNVLKIIACQNEDVTNGTVQPANMALSAEDFRKQYPLSATGLKFIMVPFFIVHYGGFCFGHVTFVIGLFGTGGSLNPRVGAALSELWHGPFWIAVAAIFGSHVYSFFTNYIRRGEYQRVNVMTLMFQPYGRIVIMHVAIIVGAGLAMAFGSALPVLMILIVGKILIDMHLHDKERHKLAVAP
jgi:cation transport ATPase